MAASVFCDEALKFLVRTDRTSSKLTFREKPITASTCFQIREALGRGDGTTSLPCPIINAPNRNEAGIPALTHQNVHTVLVRVYRRSSAVVSSSEEYVTELFSSFERQISRNSVVHISLVKAGFDENLILKTVIQKFELEKLKKKRL